MTPVMDHHPWHLSEDSATNDRRLKFNMSMAVMSVEIPADEMGVVRLVTEPEERVLLAFHLGYVGTCAGAFSDDFRDAHPEVPWSELRLLERFLHIAPADLELDGLWSAIEGFRCVVDKLYNAIKGGDMPPSASFREDEWEEEE